MADDEKSSPVYSGSETNCAVCGRRFKVGDFVAVDSQNGKLVCMEEDEVSLPGKRNDCLKVWKEGGGRGSSFENMIFSPLAGVYTGRKTYCDQCPKKFILGDLVATVELVAGDKTEEFIFCAPKDRDDQNSCPAKWVKTHGDTRTEFTIKEFWSDAVLDQ